MPDAQGIPYGAAREFTIKKFGVPLTYQETNFNVTAAAQIAVKNNPDRLSLTFVNNGSNDLFIGLSTIINSVGIKVVSAGQAINFNSDDDGELPAFAWYIISALGTACYILEGIAAAPIPQTGPNIITQRTYTGDQ